MIIIHCVLVRTPSSRLWTSKFWTWAASPGLQQNPGLFIATHKSLNFDAVVQYPFIQAVDIEILDMGSQPPAIGGAKSYATNNDEAILEAPMLWGGDARVRVAVRIKVGGFVLYLPVEVRDLQVGLSIAGL